MPSDQRAAIVQTLLDPAEPRDESQFDLPVTSLRKVVATSFEKPEGAESDDEVEVADRIDPDVISNEELAYLDKLAGLLEGNPRSLKRFVNTYRLVKTALSDVELAAFLQTPPGKSAKYLPYRICMAQLAVLCTQRSRALPLVRHADQATENPSFEDWLTQFETIDSSLASCFREAFKEDLNGLDLDAFKLWLERTRRYSFYL